MAKNLSELSAERLIEQQQIQADNHRHRSVSQAIRAAPVCQLAHHFRPPSQNDEWDECERQSETKPYLRKHQDLQRIELHRNHNQSGNHRDKSSQEDAEPNVQKAFDNHLACHSSYR